MFGREFSRNPKLGLIERAYIRLFGWPYIGDRVRAIHLKKALTDQRPESILDAGCGPGNYAFYLARRFPGAAIDAFDIEEGSIDTCKSIQEKIGTDINFYVKNLLELEAVEKYDLVLCMDVLEHIEEDGRAVENLYKALKKGGMLYMHTPKKGQSHYFKRFEDYCQWGHVREGYSTEEITGLLERKGFKVKRLESTFSGITLLAEELNQISHSKRLLAAVSFPLLMAVAYLGTKTKAKGNGIFIVAKKGEDDDTRHLS